MPSSNSAMGQTSIAGYALKRHIVLISCASKKWTYRAKAKDLYISPLFKLSLVYAKKLNPDEIYVLSAKYGLLCIEREIEPYDESLNTMSVTEVKIWAKRVIEQLQDVCSIDDSEITFLAGDKYRKYLLPQLKNYKIPLRGLRIGEQLQKLKATYFVKMECEKYHELVNK